MLDFFLSYLLIYTYSVLFFVTFISSFIFPLPATALIVASGAFAAQDFLDFRYILLFSFLGCVSGDISGYLLALFYGKKILNKGGFGKIINSPHFFKIEKYCKENSIKSILLSRFLLTGLGSTINIVSGLSKIGYKKFLVFDIIGELIYVSMFASAGYFFGNQWEYIGGIIEYIVTIFVLAVILFLLTRYVLRDKK